MYGQSESSGDFLLFFLGLTRLIGSRYSILKPGTPRHIWQQLEVAELAPAFLRRQRQLEDQTQQGVPGPAVLGPGGAVPDRGETRFNRVGGPTSAPTALS